MLCPQWWWCSSSHWSHIPFQGSWNSGSAEYFQGALAGSEAVVWWPIRCNQPEASATATTVLWFCCSSFWVLPHCCHCWGWEGHWNCYWNYNLQLESSCWGSGVFCCHSEWDDWQQHLSAHLWCLEKKNEISKQANKKNTTSYCQIIFNWFRQYIDS